MTTTALLQEALLIRNSLSGQDDFCIHTLVRALIFRKPLIM